MKNTRLETAQLSSGEVMVYTTTPGIALMKIPEYPYEFTGVVDRAWIEATRIVGRNYTTREIESGWPVAMEPHRLANMQYPQDSTGQTHINTALIGACKRGELQHIAFERHDYELLRNGGRRIAEIWKDYAITAQDFGEWLAAQKIEPSAHIAAWFAAAGVKKTKEPCETAGRILKKDMHPEWTGQRLAERMSELQGAKAPTQKLATESGLGEREIRRRIQGWNDEKTNPLSPGRMVQPTKKKTQDKAKNASAKR